MSLPKRSPELSLYSVQNLMADAFEAADPYRLFQQKIYPLLLGVRPTLEQCYCQDNGRPATEPVLLLGITLLQYMEKLPDRQAMAMLKYHLGWKLALGKELVIEALDPTLLVYFRARLLRCEQGKLLFETILRALVEAGLVPRRGKRRLDSTHVLGLLADLSEAEKLYETMRLAVLYLQEAEIALPQWFTGLLERYLQSRPDWRMNKEQARAYCQTLGKDLQLLRDWVHQQHAELLEHRSLQLLERVYAESFCVTGETLEYVKPGPGSLCNPHEPEAVMGRKRDERWRGYKAQVGESVPAEKAKLGEPTSAFITTVQTQLASEGDIKSLPQVREAEKAVGLETPEQRYVDSAYVSGAQLREEQQAGGELMGPLIAPSAQAQARREGFVIEASGQRATCPAGQANESCNLCQRKERGTSYYRLVWKNCCQHCPRRRRCVGKDGSGHIEVRIDYPQLHARREAQETEQFREAMKQRNGIEGTLSELVRGYGLRRARYRGLKKVSLCHQLIAAACNVRRWLRLLQWELQPAAA